MRIGSQRIKQESTMVTVHIVIMERVSILAPAVIMASGMDHSRVFHKLKSYKKIPEDR
jgi:hypothetical protein